MMFFDCARPAIEQRQARQGHEQDKRGGGQYLGGIAGIEAVGGKVGSADMPEKSRAIRPRRTNE